ncbi:hypothetical protein AAVH_17800 [Aphelenchoides avenae]|nr:hypothetical protein AAVH_17800 [Aphelenchus avenae]
MSKLFVLSAAAFCAFALSAAETYTFKPPGDTCLLECVFGKGGQRFRRSALADVASHGKVYDLRELNPNVTCGLIDKAAGCVKECPSTRLEKFADVLSKFTSEHCGEHYDEKFWESEQGLGEDWRAAIRKEGCEKPQASLDDACKNISGCVFGSALDTVKGKYDEDVIEFGIDLTKFLTGAILEAFIPGQLPQSCDAIFDPSQ